MERTVESLIIYPIKGFPGISLTESLCTPRGLENDRRYMVVKPDGTFYSQRTNPEMTQFTIEIKEQIIYLSKGDQHLELKIGAHSHRKVMTKVWSHDVESFEVSEDANVWFSDALGAPAKLVYMPDEVTRYKSLVVDPDKTLVSFADGYPLLILGTASIQALNDQLSNNVLFDRFRPNIVINTEIPHEEDSYDIFQCGTTTLRVNSSCARCPVVNIDQATGVSDKNVLKTLTTYRKEKNKVLFGANTFLFGESGIIRKGDQIKV